MNIQFAYLVGLICARGHLFRKDKRIIIEFAHKNKNIEGIAYCPKCGDLATKRSKNNPEGFLFCKSCGAKVDKSVKKVYEQKQSTIKSLKENITPFLSEYFKISFDIAGNDHMTFLIMDFQEDTKKFEQVSKLFFNKSSFDSFIIPNEMYSESKENKVEFVNGLLDAAGFFNAGGWFVRKGKHGNSRMRAYFQIVRNWKMPVLICNFLKSELQLPIQTIDWGHPNIRDSNMKDYYNSNPLSWSREHQVKFLPEYYNIFKLKMKHKQEMFNELVAHNLKVDFDSNDDCNPPNPISKGQLKPYHLGESDTRIPLKIRKHYDAYWQVCNDIGCVFSNECIKNSYNPKLLYLLGKTDGDSHTVAEELDDYRKKLTNKIIDKNKTHEVKRETKITKIIRTNPEQKLYKPISEWLEKDLKHSFSESKVHDTSAYYLDKFILQNNLYDEFSSCEEYKIKPDIVGFLVKEKQLVFVEVKVGELTIKDLGQLLGYCLVANPRRAILISPKKPSLNLLKALKTNPNLLRYNNRTIEIGVWKDNNCEIIGV